jgi:general secretion pathway protein H
MRSADLPALPRVPASGSRAGFTLLELILVMVIASLILGLGVMFFANTLPGARLSATARELSASIRQMKFLAQNRGEDLILTVDLDMKRYGIDGVRMKAIPPDVSIMAVDPVAGEVRNGKYLISFHSTGGVEGGMLVLSARKKAVYIEMDPVVGSVRVR